MDVFEIGRILLEVIALIGFVLGVPAMGKYASIAKALVEGIEKISKEHPELERNIKNIAKEHSQKYKVGKQLDMIVGELGLKQSGKHMLGTLKK